MRTRLVVPVLVALLPGAVLLAPPAQAAPLGDNRLICAVVFSSDAASGTSCSKTAGDGDTDATTFAADGVARTVTSSGSATYASSDGTDVTTMSGTSTSTITATQTATRLDTHCCRAARRTSGCRRVTSS